MRVLLDACVLYPTVLRELLVGAAAAGLYAPLWSSRILAEWQVVADRRADGAVAAAEIAALTDAWPEALVTPTAATGAALRLPDPADTHVLAAAIDGGADTLVTLNVRDFPARQLAPRGIRLRHPDPFLCELLAAAPGDMTALAEQVRARAERLSGAAQPMRPLMKRANLPRFGRSLERV